ncbi:MAG: hypothetical protein ACI9G5_002772, partial [Paracoccaceae bacterium]
TGRLNPQYEKGLLSCSPFFMLSPYLHQGVYQTGEL